MEKTKIEGHRTDAYWDITVWLGFTEWDLKRQGRIKVAKKKRKSHDW